MASAQDMLVNNPVFLFIVEDLNRKIRVLQEEQVTSRAKQEAMELTNRRLHSELEARIEEVQDLSVAHESLVYAIDQYMEHAPDYEWHTWQDHVRNADGIFYTDNLQHWDEDATIWGDDEPEGEGHQAVPHVMDDMTLNELFGSEHMSDVIDLTQQEEVIEDEDLVRNQEEGMVIDLTHDEEFDLFMDGYIEEMEE